MWESFYKLDIYLFNQIFKWNGRKFFDSLIYWISRTGDGYLYGLAGIWLLFLHDSFSRKILYAGLIAFAIELPIHKIIKQLIKRGRPFDRIAGAYSLISPPDKYSFPSGHTAAAFLFANVISELFPFLQIPLWSWACLVGFSRVYLGVHYPLDVLVGLIIGISSSMIGLWLIF